MVAFAVAIYTDKLDGDIARSRNLVTDFGKIADPIADKLLIGSALVMLSVLGELPWWVTLVILVREWGITALRFFVIRYGVIPGLPRRQAQDRGADRRDLLVSPALGCLRGLAGVGRVRGHDGRGGHHGVDRGGIRGRGPAPSGEGQASGTNADRTGTREQIFTIWPEQAVRQALDAGRTVATAESLTAGMVSAVLADTPGASGMLQGGVVAYQNSVKEDVLRVSAELLARAGSVDGDVARRHGGRSARCPGRRHRRHPPPALQARKRTTANPLAPSIIGIATAGRDCGFRVFLHRKQCRHPCGRRAAAALERLLEALSA